MVSYFALQLRDSVIEYFDFLQNQTLLRRKKNPQDSRERNMMSKFLCYRYDFACPLTTLKSRGCFAALVLFVCQ